MPDAAYPPISGWETDPLGELLRMARDWRYSTEFVGQVFRFRADQIEAQFKRDPALAPTKEQDA